MKKKTGWTEQDRWFDRSVTQRFIRNWELCAFLRWEYSVCDQRSNFDGWIFVIECFAVRRYNNANPNTFTHTHSHWSGFLSVRFGSIRSWIIFIMVLYAIRFFFHSKILRRSLTPTLSVCRLFCVFRFYFIWNFVLSMVSFVLMPMHKLTQSAVSVFFLFISSFVRSFLSFFGWASIFIEFRHFTLIKSHVKKCQLQQ